MDDRNVVEPVTEARQGVTGHNVRYVLIISCALVVALFLAAMVFVGR